MSNKEDNKRRFKSDTESEWNKGTDSLMNESVAKWIGNTKQGVKIPTGLLSLLANESVN